MKKRLWRAGILLLSFMVISAMTVTVSAGVTDPDNRTFDTPEAAEAWKADVEATYAAINSGEEEYAYYLFWNGPNKIVTASHQEPDGAPVPAGPETSEDFGPYQTEALAAAALNTAKESDPSTALHSVTFSAIVSSETGSSTAVDFTSEKFSSKSERDAALADKLSEAQQAGGKNIVTKEFQNAGFTIKEDSFEKYDDSATSYSIPAGSYIVVKQAKWFFIWAPQDLSAHEDQLIAVAKANDPSLNSAAYKGLFTANTVSFDKELYKFSKSASSYTLEVCNSSGNPDSGKISHMDYIQFSFEGDFWFSISYEVPDKEYSFTKTVQDFKQNYKTVEEYGYEISYTVLPVPRDPGMPINEDPPGNPIVPPGPDDPQTPSGPPTPEEPTVPPTPEKPNVPTEPADPAPPAVEKVPVTDKTPATGDSSANAIAALAMMVSAMTVIAAMFRRKTDA